MINHKILQIWLFLFAITPFSWLKPLPYQKKYIHTKKSCQPQWKIVKQYQINCIMKITYLVSIVFIDSQVRRIDMGNSSIRLDCRRCPITNIRLITCMAILGIRHPLSTKIGIIKYFKILKINIIKLKINPQSNPLHIEISKSELKINTNKQKFQVNN